MIPEHSSNIVTGPNICHKIVA